MHLRMHVLSLLCGALCVCVCTEKAQMVVPKGRDIWLWVPSFREPPSLKINLDSSKQESIHIFVMKK